MLDNLCLNSHNFGFTFIFLKMTQNWTHLGAPQIILSILLVGLVCFVYFVIFIP